MRGLRLRIGAFLLESSILCAVPSSPCGRRQLWFCGSRPLSPALYALFSPQGWALGRWAAKASVVRAFSAQAVLSEGLPSKRTGPELSRGEALWGKELSGSVQEGRGPRLA